LNSVLVVCIGNICRSPMAHALLAKALPQLTVSSAGTGALVGHPADAIAQALMAERGLDLGDHRARQVTQSMCVEADLILTMDEGLRRHIENNYPLTRGRVFRLAETARLNIPDPYRMGQGAFEHALQLIDAGIKTWAERIRQFK